jgi:hypothetical protein
MDPRDKLFTIIFSGFMLIMLLSLFIILTGCAQPIEATGGIRV